MAEEFRDVTAIAALEDELRRNMYLLIRDSAEPLTREDISSALGVSIKLAAFHLDKLVDRGVLKAHYARRKEKTGLRAAGRSSKFYEVSGNKFQVLLPTRRYDLAGSILAETIHRMDKKEGAQQAVRRARIKGHEIARELKSKVRKGGGRERAIAVARRTLELLGYEPFMKSELEIRLKNCPFDVLAKQAPDVVCPMNKGLIDGVLGELDVKSTQVSAGPPNGECCVSVKTKN